MRIFIILAVAIFALVGCSKTPELHSRDALELHVIGISKGHGTSNPNYVNCRDLCARDRDCKRKCRKRNPRTIYSMSVPVEIDRPGKSVSLILAADAPIQWQITHQRKTEIDRIILIGYHADKASVKINGKPYHDVARRKEIVAPSEVKGRSFRALVDKMPEELGFEKLSSFQGPARFGTPEAGFIISDVQTDQQVLEPDYLKYKLRPIDKALDLRLAGKIAGQSGEFLPDGTFIRPLGLIPAFNVAVSTDGQKGYRYTSDGILPLFSDDGDGRETNLIALPDEAFDIGHFSAISLDEKRNQLLAIFQAGGNSSEIMALDLRTKTWREFGSTGINFPNSLFFDTVKDRFLVIVRDFPQNYSIGSLDPVSGQFKVLREIKDEAFDGMTDLYDVGNLPPPAVYIVGLSGQHITLAFGRRDVHSGPNGEAGAFRRIYTLDLQTGNVKLTYYD